MIVSVVGADFRLCHGVYDEEKYVPNHFVVDCFVHFENLGHKLIVDYSRVYQLIEVIMKKPKETLEELLSLIIETLKKEYPFISKIEVEIKKMNPPFSSNLKYVSVTDVKHY